ncbi:aldehyde dehydrogenase family protein [Amycolatopsis anabasis]|uniref:aldehyde dehydrogenase family protein n=1 Tax=Amycolatopsis anabasis TaxID=1840409 RepID=UPI00131EA356|nr:aldehyde dehydrogenase family protein [Amycolatopsis anabasis]
MLRLDVLGPTGPYRSRKQETVHDVTGNPVATLSLAPRLFVTRAMKALHLARTAPVDDRIAAIARAGELFAAGTVAGLPVEEYQRTVSAVSGMSISAVRTATGDIARAAAQAHRSVRQARPVGAVDDWRDPFTRTGRAVWTRRGDVFAVHAAGNHPAVHQGWLEALALGYRLAVRPSRREPFTPHRLVTALREAGFAEDQVVLLPTDHDAAGEILGQADLGMVYGGGDVVRKYADHPGVLPQGPGRSKILLTAEADWESALDTIVDSVSAGGGVGCVNTTAVLVEGDPAPVAEAIAERLAALPSLPPQDERAILPVLPVETARQWEKHLLAKATGTRAWLGGDGIVDELGDGSAVLRPAVHQVDSPFAGQIGVELGFPCVWVAPWHRDAGIGPLRETLVLTAITTDERLIEELVAEPTIGNVYVGEHPTSWMEPGLPHDGYLAEFLMRTKTVLR